MWTYFRVSQAEAMSEAGRARVAANAPVSEGSHSCSILGHCEQTKESH